MNERSLIANFTKKFRNIYCNAMMTYDLSLNDKHVFISDFVIDNRQTDFRFIVDKLLTMLFILLENFSLSIIILSTFLNRAFFTTFDSIFIIFFFFRMS